MDDHHRQDDVLVLGAGIVGIATGLAARRRGLRVTVLDRREPGRETSHGNAGVLSSGSIFPLNGRALWKTLPATLTNRHPALRYSIGHLAANPAWIARFLGHALAREPDPRRAALHGLITPSLQLHRQWIREAGLGHRLRETGWLRLWRSPAFAAAAAECEALAAFGIRSDVVDDRAIGELEPAITARYRVGLLHGDTASVDSPGAIVEGYAALLRAAGGQIRLGEAIGLRREAEGWTVRLADGACRARNVVVALGPWSGELLASLGYRVPLRWERGYHREFAGDAAKRLARPVHDSEAGFVIAPVERGTRITTGVELAHRDAPSNLGQIRQAEARARAMIPLGEPVGDVWRGARPTLPDSLPMIGPAPRHPGLWCAFGHQHIGFSTGPGTGEAIAAMIAGEPAPFATAPYSPGRFM